METPLLSFLSKLGPLKHQLLLYSLVGCIVLLYAAEKTDKSHGIILGIGAVLLLLSGSAFWLLAYLKLPNNAQEKAFLSSTAAMTAYDQLQRTQS